MRLLCIHAHYDDFEFVAAGTFELMRRRALPGFQSKLLVCTDGKAGHHFRPREETGRVREAEQARSAAIGQYAFETLTRRDGSRVREACMTLDTETMAALWKSVRDFQPDFIVAPPVASDPLAGIHIDHVTVAEAVRKLAYMINVPHAFSPEYPTDETKSVWIKTPVILNPYDAYMAGENAFDLAISVEAAFDLIAEMTWQHQSQIVEWIPWIARHHMPESKDFGEWKKTLRARYVWQNRELGIPSEDAYEYFTVTAWGAVPALEELLAAFPFIDQANSKLDSLQKRLKRWRGGA
ncbi:MAG TPA: PIG-L family deacetylase [Methylomirabilota bacterium]|nr:PIG-L family deacetylase [Methylomirabilota bacterium]